MSIGLKHVYPLFPSISDTGSEEPESCVFSMLLNLTAAALLFVVYVRHKQISEFFRAKNLSDKKQYVSIVNLVSTAFGILACLGLDIVANFQINRVEYVHDTGVLLCYWCSSVYIFIQTVLSFWMIPDMTSLWIVAVRGILGVTATIFVLVNIISEAFAEKEFKDFKGEINRTNIVSWDETDPGYANHIIAGVSQWITVIALGSFILTYYVDFKRVTIYPPELVMLADPVPRPVEATSFKSFSFVTH